MIKTMIFAAGVACGLAIASAMTDEQRRMVTEKLGTPMKRVTNSNATQRIGDSVRNVADTAAERAASKIDGIADAIEPDQDAAGNVASAN